MFVAIGASCTVQQRSIFIGQCISMYELFCGPSVLLDHVKFVNPLRRGHVFDWREVGVHCLPCWPSVCLDHVKRLYRMRTRCILNWRTVFLHTLPSWLSVRFDHVQCIDAVCRRHVFDWRAVGVYNVPSRVRMYWDCLRCQHYECNVNCLSCWNLLGSWCVCVCDVSSWELLSWHRCNLEHDLVRQCGQLCVVDRFERDEQHSHVEQCADTDVAVLHDELRRVAMCDEFQRDQSRGDHLNVNDLPHVVQFGSVV